MPADKTEKIVQSLVGAIGEEEAKKLIDMLVNIRSRAFTLGHAAGQREGERKGIERAAAVAGSWTTGMAGDNPHLRTMTATREQIEDAIRNLEVGEE